MRQTGFAPDVHAMIDARAFGLCEVCGDGLVTEHHHRRPRGAGGSRQADTNTTANALALCHACHRMIESNRTVALMMGWLIPQRSRLAVSPSMKRVMYRGEWCFLRDDGTVATEWGISAD